MKSNRGFTLIEVVMTAGILACGLVAVAAVFSFAIRTNGYNRHAAIATALLYEKMEEFRSAPFNDPVWLNPTGTETVVRSGFPYRRSWQIDPGIPRKVAVVVQAKNGASIRAVTLVSPCF